LNIYRKYGANQVKSLYSKIYIWWTDRVWLIGNTRRPKKYTAQAWLSSIGESAWCMTEKVKKDFPYFPLKRPTTFFDITKPQPQIICNPWFCVFKVRFRRNLPTTMALRKGGLSGIQKSSLNSKGIRQLLELSTGPTNQEIWKVSLNLTISLFTLKNQRKNAPYPIEKENCVGHSTKHLICACFGAPWKN